MIDKVSVDACTLCGGCRNACPTDAISYAREHRGFAYPVIDPDKCVGCDRCERVCPVLAPGSRSQEGYPTAYAARTKDEEVRRTSTSGGVFYELASLVLGEGGMVCGAVFDEGFHVRHILSDRREDLVRMMGSKYAQSDMGSCYREIKQALAKGVTVLFSGCPCQVAGLRCFLGRDDPHLILVELICHGVPSDSLLQTYISLREKQYGAALERLEFRNKDLGWHRSAVKMEFANGKVYREPGELDAYGHGFYGNITLKESCYHCRFRNFSAGGDIILGDLWGAEVSMPRADDNKGLSALLVLSDKGQAQVERLPLIMEPCELDTVIRYNQSLVRSAEPSPLRETFCACTAERGYAVAIRKHLERGRLFRLRCHARYRLRCLWYALRGRDKPLY